MPFSGLPGFGLGFLNLIQLIVFFILAVVVWRERKGFVSGTPIVLKRFRLSQDPAAGAVIEITGRVSGVVSWILTLLRVEPEFQFTATRDSVSIRRESLRGTQHTFVPLSAVTGTNCGYQRSILAFAFAVYFAFDCVSYLLVGFLSNNRDEVGTNMGLAFGFLILAGIAALIYFLSKKVGLWIESSLHSHGLSFKRSVIENVSVELPQALRAIEILNSLVLNARTAPPRAAAAAAGAPTSPTTGTGGREGAGPVACTKCSAVNPAGMRFCENCGLALS